MGQDRLPWSEVKDLLFRNSKGVTVQEHNISFRGMNDESVVLPIFVTCHATAADYYELIIEANGGAKLFDGSHILFDSI
jgi:hypothetical protein